jgi:hypothetical protein
VLGKVTQINARFGLTDRLEVHLIHVRIPAGKGAAKTKGRSLDVMIAIKRSIVLVKAAFLCLAHALTLAMAQVNGDAKYASYTKGCQLVKPVEELLQYSDVDLCCVGGLEGLQLFEDYLSEYNIFVYNSLSSD